MMKTLKKLTVSL